MDFECIRGHHLAPSLLRKDPVVFDLGANLGEFSTDMLRRFGGTYTAIEANPALSAKLPQSDRISVRPCAVAAKEGEISFNVSINPVGSSILKLPKESELHCTLDSTVTVRARTLSSLLEEVQGPIDVIKIDIEGAEVEVLNTVPLKDLKRAAQITVEFHSDPIFGFNIAKETEQAIRRVKSAGFACLDFSRGSRIDVLFLNREHYRPSWLSEKRQEFRVCPPPALLKAWGLIPKPLKTGVSRLMDAVARK